MIVNPVIKGFNPDPSIVRVGDDYYLATSTFEWYPGVQIHHSKNLVNWELIYRPLDEKRLLDLEGVPDSCGVWAPCLSYSNGKFYLVYSNVRSFDGMWKDTPNYLITSESIFGPWSDHVFLSSAGFDGSLFHDEDGKKWFLSMLLDHRKGRLFGGIIMQEYDEKNQSLVGKLHHIFKGSELGITEGPHIYKKDGYYYLITAEGGTDYGHAVSIARSRNITGPYKLHPNNPILTSAHKPDLPLQRTGHGDIVQSGDGNYYIFFLAGRPIDDAKRCTLGRETCIEELEWKQGEWPVLKHGSNYARLVINSDKVVSNNNPTLELLNFKRDKLSIHYQSLRTGISEDWLSYDNDKGQMIITGRESLSSTFKQSFVARRVQSFHINYLISLEFNPESFQHMAGLVCYYNTGHHYYFHLCGDINTGGLYLNLVRHNNFKYEELLDELILLENGKAVELRVDWKYAELKFSYRQNKDDWINIPEIFDATILSDDYVREGGEQYRPAFTGSFVGVACQDLTGQGKESAFNFLEYRELDL